MNRVNLCRSKDDPNEFANGNRTKEQIKEYQKKYRDAKKKRENPFVFEVRRIKN